MGNDRCDRFARDPEEALGKRKLTRDEWGKTCITSGTRTLGIISQRVKLVDRKRCGEVEVAKRRAKMSAAQRKHDTSKRGRYRPRNIARATKPRKGAYRL